MKQRSSHAVRHILSGLVLLALGVHGVYSQDEDATPPPVAPPAPVLRGEPQEAVPAPKLELDLEQLLTDRTVTGTAVEDPVWIFTQDAETQYVQLPFRLTPGEEVTELTHTTVNFRGGRFIAWRVPVPGQPGNTGLISPRNLNQPNNRPVGRPQPRPTPPGRLPGNPGFPSPLPPRGVQLPIPGSVQSVEATMQFQDFGPGPGFGPAGRVPGQADSNIDTSRLPGDAPRLARRFEIEPDGTLRWKIERGLPGAEADPSRSLYAFKADPRLVAQYRPTNPRITRNPNETPQDFAARRRQEQEAFREASLQFRDLQEQVTNLPEEFEVSGVDTVWAVLEVRRSVPEIGVNMEDGAWSISMRHLESVRTLAQTARGGRIETATVRDLQELARTGHTYNLRILAMALGKSGALSGVQPNDQLSRVIMEVIRGPNRQGAEAMIEQIALTLPPTQGTAALLTEAAPLMTPRLKLLSLRSMLHMNTQDPAAARQAAVAITGALRDPQGASPAEVLTVALEIANKMPEHNQSLFVSAIQFEQLVDERLDQAIAAVIGEAGIDPLAARWLDFKLLGATDVRLAERTLELLAQAKLDNPSKTATGTSDPANAADEASDAPNDIHVRLGARILVESINHSLFRAIQHGEQRLRALAWDSLKAFTFSPDVAEAQRTATLERRAAEQARVAGNNGFGPGATPGRPVPRPINRNTNQPQPFDLYRTLVDAALTQPTLPPQVVAFLGSEGPSQRAADQLARLVLHGDAETQGLAAGALRQSQQPIDQSLMAMDLKQRHTFALNVYRQLLGHEPLVAGLMLDPSPQSPSVRWFGRELATGGPPDPSQWFQAYQGEQPLLQLAGVNNEDLSAGAIAALVGSVGGDDEAARHFIETVNNLPDRSPASIALAWSQVRGEIFKDRLRKTAGKYRLVMNVYGEPAEATTPGGRPNTVPGTPGPARPGAFPGGPGPNGRPDPFGPAPYNPGGPVVPPGAVPPRLNGNRPGGFNGAPNNQTSKPPVEGEPQQVIALGNVTFVVEDDQIRFEDLDITLQVPESHLAIVFASLSELKLLPISELATLPLEDVTQPLQMTPRAEQSWSGWVALPDNRFVELVMTPVQ